MIENLALAIGIIVAAGFIGAAVSHKLKLPLVTGYIVIGILLSPSLLNVISESVVTDLNIVVSIGLGVIAYAIGARLDWGSVKESERSIAWILPIQSLGTMLVVTLVTALTAPLFLSLENADFAHAYFPLAFVIGAIAAATAPAATIAIVHECEARGPLTTVLLSLVALDDGLTIVLFSIAIGISEPLVIGSKDISLYSTAALPFVEIAGSIGIGAGLALVLYFIMKHTKTRALSLVAVFGTIMLCVGINARLEWSLILANMTIGFTVANMLKKDGFVTLLDDIEDLIFVLFFVLAGLHFNLDAMRAAGFLALIIFGSRFFAKYFGARIGAVFAHSEDAVRKYLGLTLIPAAGVSLGLALLAKHTLPGLGDTLLSIVIAVVILSEIVAPPLTKYAIERAGESRA